MSTSPEGSAMVSAPGEPIENQKNIAAPEVDLVESLRLSVSTYRACIRRGDGPRTFKLGRRNFILLDDWEAWLRQMAKTGA